MTVRFELLALFRHKAGTGEIELEVVPAGGRGENAAGIPTVLDALRCLEQRAEAGSLGALEGDRLRKGVLLFGRSPGAGMRRILEPAGEPLGPAETLVLSTAMEGG